MINSLINLHLFGSAVVILHLTARYFRMIYWKKKL